MHGAWRLSGRGLVRAVATTFVPGAASTITIAVPVAVRVTGAVVATTATTTVATTTAAAAVATTTVATTGAVATRGGVRRGGAVRSGGSVRRGGRATVGARGGWCRRTAHTHKRSQGTVTRDEFITWDDVLGKGDGCVCVRDTVVL